MNLSVARERLARHPWLGVVLLLTTLLTILCAKYLVGDQAFAFRDIGSDTYVSYYANQVALARQIREVHSITWNFFVGAGAYQGAFSDLVNTLGAILFPPDAQLSWRIYGFMARIILSSVLFFAYLRTIGCGRASSAIGANAFALSGYMLVNGQWDDQGTMALLFALQIFALEINLKNRKWLWLILSGICIGSGGGYSIYLLGFSSAAYLLLRSVTIYGREWVGSTIRDSVRCLVPLVAGLLIAAPLAFPNIFYLIESPRISGDVTATDVLLKEAFHPARLSIILVQLASIYHKDIFGSALLWNGIINWFEAPTFFVGMLPLIFIPALLFAKDPRGKRLAIVCVVIFSLYIIFPGVRYSVYAFKHGAYRYSTLLISTLILVTGIVSLDRAARRGLLNKFWTGAAALALIAGAVVVWLTRPLVVDNAVVFRVVLVTACYALIALFGLSSLRWKTASMALLLILSGGELVWSGYADINDRASVRSQKVDGAEHVNYWDYSGPIARRFAATKGTRDFSRLEKTFDSVYLNDAMVQDYTGIKTYFFTGRSLNRLNDAFQVRRPAPAVTYIGSYVNRPHLLDMFSVKYLLAHAGDSIPDGFDKIGSENGVDIYRNPAAWPGMKVYFDVQSESEALKLPIEDMDASIESTAIVSNDEVDVIKSHLASGVNATSPGGVVGDNVLVYKDETHLVATVHAAAPGLAVLSIPDDRGWSVRVNGQKQPTIRTNFGMLGVLVPAGTLTLKASYYPPFRAVGWLAAIISLMMVIGYYLFDRAGKSSVMGDFRREQEPRPFNSVPPRVGDK